jgi:hypothetical protein
VERLNRWLTLFANLGIVAGLVLVAFQLEQAERYADAEQANAEFAFTLGGLDSAFAEALPEAWARARLNASDLTDVEVSLIDLYLRRRTAEEVFEWVQASRGLSLYSPEFSARVFVDGLLGNDTALRWWELNRHIVSQNLPWFVEFVEVVDELLRERGSEQRTLHQRQIRALIDGPLPGGVGLDNVPSE